MLVMLERYHAQHLVGAEWTRGYQPQNERELFPAPSLHYFVKEVRMRRGVCG